MFLYDSFKTLEKFNYIKKDVPKCILNNLRQEFPLREYQGKAFCYFDYFYNNNFEGKQPKPYHLLFNMATGSGKTLIMAGLILYLYDKGYRNFLFFVNSTTIIDKTKDNFLNTVSSKYLFADKIMFDCKEVEVKEVETFDEADKDNINIKFTTIQKLHIDLLTPRENGLSYEDFKNKKIVLIADESDNLEAITRGKTLNIDGTWQNTVETIHKSNYENILLNFTATMDFGTEAIKQKYMDKTIYKYDLSQFCIDKYSKEIEVLQSDSALKDRIIQALILNLYRQELASSYNINIKPVILFKSKTIPDNKKNEKDFYKLIEDLDITDIERIENSTNNAPTLQTAFKYFREHEITNEGIVKRTKTHFIKENCIGTNEDKDLEKNQLLLNSLEDGNNPVRAIFAVNKLDRGWDVLNLFDIVRMYQTRDSEKGSATRAEAQLIGRGARYFPFKIEDEQEKYKRKYDNEVTDLSILETLYYHSLTDARYISELKSALVESGILEGSTAKKQLKLKEGFKKTNFYRDGCIILNQREDGLTNKKSLNDLTYKNINYRYKVKAVRSVELSIMREQDTEKETLEVTSRDICLKDIPYNVKRYALTTNKYYYFNNLKRYFKGLKSSYDFITDNNYLGGYSITFEGEKDRVDNLTNEDYLLALQELLKEIQGELEKNVINYEVSKFDRKKRIFEVFTDKELKIQKGTEREDGQEDFVKDKDWYVYNANYGTSQEKAFVNMFDSRYDVLKNKYENIYLIRNELFFKIYDEQGNAFQPDYVLYVKKKGDKGDKDLVYQIFIEPKGEQLIEQDRWKEDFMKKIKEGGEEVNIDTDKYRITAVPMFYSKDKENDFKTEFNKLLEIQ